MTALSTYDTNGNPPTDANGKRYSWDFENVTKAASQRVSLVYFDKAASASRKIASKDPPLPLFVTTARAFSAAGR
jgi:hypothetical protein